MSVGGGEGRKGGACPESELPIAVARLNGGGSEGPSEPEPERRTRGRFRSHWRFRLPHYNDLYAVLARYAAINRGLAAVWPSTRRSRRR